MAAIRGFVIFSFSVVITILETYFMILQPLIFDIDLQIPEVQYWSIALPVFVITLLLTTTSAWIGYTMMTTPEPVRLDYEEAYEVAQVEIDTTEE